MRRAVITAGVLALPLALATGCAAGSQVQSAGGGHRSPAVRAGQHPPVPVPLLVARATSKVAYVLAAARPGNAGTATELFRTADGGLRFSEVSAPVLRPGGTAPLAIRIMTFANARDGVAVLGSAGQQNRVLVTDDGARQWRQASLGGRGAITAVAGHGRLTYALRLGCGSADVCHHLRLYRAAAGSATWTRAAASGTAGVNGAGGIGLAAWGSHVWLTTGNGVAPEIGLLSSADSGQSFSRVASVAAIGCFPTPSSAAVIWLYCPGGMLVTFDRFAASTGQLTLLHATGAGTGNTFLSPLSGQQVLFGTATGGKGGRIYLSRDAGRSFAPVGYLPGPARGLYAQVTFLTARRALALVSQRLLLRTSDGGMSWIRVAL